MTGRHLAPLVLLLALSLAIAGCVGEGAQPVLEFSTGACTGKEDAYTPPEAGITGTAWANDYTFQADGFVKTYCGGAEITGDYALDGRNLVLFYTITTPGPVTRCLCTRGVRYRFTDLPYGEYRVRMEKK
jgi:hypothetical protein